MLPGYYGSRHYKEYSAILMYMNPYLIILSDLFGVPVA